MVLFVTDLYLGVAQCYSVNVTVNTFVTILYIYMCIYIYIQILLIILLVCEPFIIESTVNIICTNRGIVIIFSRNRAQ